MQVPISWICVGLFKNVFVLRVKPWTKPNSYNVNYITNFNLKQKKKRFRKTDRKRNIQDWVLNSFNEEITIPWHIVNDIMTEKYKKYI